MGNKWASRSPCPQICHEYDHLISDEAIEEGVIVNEFYLHRSRASVRVSPDGWKLSEICIDF